MKSAALPAATQRAQAESLMRAGQTRLWAAFEQLEHERAAQDETYPAQRFVASHWERPGGGGGTPGLLTDGAVFERAGVNVSAVFGSEVPPGIWQARPHTRGKPFFATGISLVLHPRNPYVPAFHANYRYFEVETDWWCGGGMDLTPAYGDADDARAFHCTLRDHCARHAVADYAAFKAACDDYFTITHRGEMRGIGGIFFAMLRPDGPDAWAQIAALIEDGITTIVQAYTPIVRRHMHRPYGERERQWQLYRRGRYVEFNLVYDIGTVFGLQTDGDPEAILMSLPPLARWAYRYQPEAGSPEAALAPFLQPRDWATAPD